MHPFHLSVREFLRGVEGRQILNVDPILYQEGNQIVKKYASALLASWVQGSEPAVIFEDIVYLVQDVAKFDPLLDNFSQIDEFFDRLLGFDKDHYQSWVHQTHQEVWQNRDRDLRTNWLLCSSPEALRMSCMLTSGVYNTTAEQRALLLSRIFEDHAPAYSAYHFNDILAVCLHDLLSNYFRGTRSTQLSRELVHYAIHSHGIYTHGIHTFYNVECFKKPHLQSFYARSIALLCLRRCFVGFLARGRRLRRKHWLRQELSSICELQAGFVGQAITVHKDCGDLEVGGGSRWRCTTFLAFSADALVNFFKAQMMLNPDETRSSVDLFLAAPAQVLLVRRLAHDTSPQFARPAQKQSIELSTDNAFGTWLASQTQIWGVRTDDGRVLEILTSTANGLSWSDAVPASFYGDLQPDIYFAPPGYQLKSMPVDPKVEVDPKDWKKACTMRLYFEDMDKLAAQKQPEKDLTASKVREVESERQIKQTLPSDSELSSVSEQASQSEQNERRPGLLKNNSTSTEADLTGTHVQSKQPKRPTRRRELSATFEGFQK